MKTGPKPRPIADRFWERVRKGKKCWVWRGARLPRGYGKFSSGRRGAWVLAHRASWELNRGPIPRGMHVLHRCDTPACVKPEHLFLGTNADNITDRVKKGRSAKGEKHWNHVLTERSVRRIRRLHARGALQRELAAAFNTSQGHISAVVRRKVWKHVPKGGRK